ncbi:DUF3397 domain-containing protein [Salipaludibacillus agaradhaerens]|jgi:hypothetical protein|uniref:DUF3397 domain-containing protein n=1 Tax=Salipaludibacillus agaradhaerens TaxID=76935 RepID=UPI000995E8D2|nr:DUF3397 domain-containing protein [Salipaludibacillus agaradhaerens]MCR6107179.1 DUF3397 domain-containing protein [Salipaludibacillus agaradhaerens]MCR6119209.1 DUF3397 domain-containing protein [Salipaludibacillus agaradhaerens]UJW58251.1 DUF3397 domain-containing protein [Bacillus sp. A116_S68]
MAEVTAVITATLITAPLLGLYIFYLIIMKVSQNKQRSFKIAVDATVLLFIASVYFMVYEIWGVRTGWLIVMFFLLTAIVFTFVHWKNYEEIDIKRVFKGVWRFQFVVFFLLYFIVIMYGLIISVMT